MPRVISKESAEAVDAFPSPVDLTGKFARAREIAAKLPDFATEGIISRAERLANLGHWSDENIARFWLLNCELTRRGIAPRWRRLPRVGDIPREDVVPVPLHLTGGKPTLRPPAKLDLLLRWIDLQWLATAYRGHIPGTRWTRNLFLHAEFGGYTPWKVATLREPAHRTAQKLNLTEEMMIGLVVFKTGAIRERHSAAENFVKRHLAKLDVLCEVGRLTPEERDRRVIHCRALRLAHGGPQMAATIFTQITGEKITRQSMSAMRNKLERELRVGFHGHRRLRSPT